MELLNKLTLKNLKLNKKRTIVTIIGIILSVALITAVAGMFFSARGSLIAYEVGRKGDFHYSFSNVKMEELKTFELNQKIESFAYTTEVGYAKVDGIENEYKPYVYIMGFSDDAYKRLCVNLMKGHLPENENEIVIPAHLSSNGGVTYNIGDTITLETGERVSDGDKLSQANPYDPNVEEEIIHTTTKTYTVVGIMERLSKNIEVHSAPGYTCITYADENSTAETVNVYARYTAMGLCNRDAITARIIGVSDRAYELIYGSGEAVLGATEEELNAAKEEVNAAEIEVSCNNYLIEMESGIFSSSSLAALASVVMVVVIIIIFTSIFCIKNSFDISITEKIRQYGMLSSIGATKKQIRKNVYYEAGILAAIGIPFGIFFGNLAAYILMEVAQYFMTDMLATDLFFVFSWEAVIFAVVLGFVTVMLSARRSAVKASKIAPIQAIRNSGEIKIKTSKIKTPKIVSRLFGIGGEISYKNLKRSKKKYRTTVISIMVCVMVFIALSSFIHLAFDAIAMEFKMQDYNLSINNFNDEDDLEEKIALTRQLDGISQISVTKAYRTLMIHTGAYSEEYKENYPKEEMGEEITDWENNTDRISVVVLDTESYEDYVKELGLDYEEVKDKGILMNRIYVSVYDETEEKVVTYEMDKYSYQAGDRILGQIENYYAEKEEDAYDDVVFTIGALTETAPMAYNNYSSNGLLIVEEGNFEALFDHGAIYMDCESASATLKELEQIWGENVSINNMEENVKSMESLYTLLAILLYGFITVIALIGVTNIFNTINTNMNLRRSEFAMLQSVGMTKFEFNRMILLESVFYVGKSLIFGIPLGCLLSFFIYQVLAGNGLGLKFKLPAGAILISMLAVFVLITAIMKYSIGKIEKQNIIETIRNENI